MLVFLRVKYQTSFDQELAMPPLFPLPRPIYPPLLPLPPLSHLQTEETDMVPAELYNC